jgi:hypothetical protein
MTYAERLISEFGREITQLGLYHEDIYALMDLRDSVIHCRMLHLALKLQRQVNDLQKQIDKIE